MKAAEKAFREAEKRQNQIKADYKAEVDAIIAETLALSKLEKPMTFLVKPGSLPAPVQEMLMAEEYAVVVKPAPSGGYQTNITWDHFAPSTTPTAVPSTSTETTTPKTK